MTYIFQAILLVAIAEDPQLSSNRALNTTNFYVCAIKVRTDQREVVIASIYCPPNSPLTANHYEELLSELGPNFIIAGDWNAHHRLWGSRNSTIRGRTLADIVLASHMQVLATGGPTHYPYSQRMPSAIDFAIYKGIRSDLLSISEIV